MQKENVFFSVDKFDGMTDEQIVLEVQKGDKQAISYLMNKYKELVNIKVSKYFMVGAERDDIVQEGLLAYNITYYGTSCKEIISGCKICHWSKY